GVPDPAAAHSHDVVRVHHGRRTARGGLRRRRGDASRHGRRRVLRDARRHVLRTLADSGVLCGRSWIGSQACAGIGRAPVGISAARWTRLARRARRRGRLMRSMAWMPLGLAALVAACVSSPNYQPPTVVVAPAFQALSDTSARRVATTTGASAADSVAPSPVSLPDSFSSAAPDSALAVDSTLDTMRVAALAPGTSVSGEAPDSAFWSGLGDSTLTGLVREALRASPDVRAARSRFFEARSQRRLASLDLVPTITATASVARQQLSAAQFPGTVGALPRQDLWDGGVDASWELDVFGRVSHNVRAGRAFEESADEQVRDAQLSLAAEVARTYFELRGAQSELAVAERNADNQRRTMKLTEQRLSAGSGTAFDVERARAELSLTLAQTPTIEARIAASRNQL